MTVPARPLALSTAAAITLMFAGAPGWLNSASLPQDEGAAGTWQKLLKIQTTASVMHTTAHPDDEHGGVLTMLSRGEGARVSLLTLNRGEAGDNAIGSELFDALGLIRTEELLAADRYYGVDTQYFTTVIDYGFSKRLDEALEKWGRQNVLRDVVRIIRTDRPFVLAARFQGNQRDGHGNHQTAGLITQEAFTAAGDPAAFPEQIAEGLRPWQPLKLYRGGTRENEAWTVRIDPGRYDPVLGESYQTFSRIGLSFQRSQNSGRLNAQPGPSVSYYERLASVVDAPAKEIGFFDGIDTTIPGIYRALRKSAPAGADALLTTIDQEVRSAAQTFTMTNPASAAPALARALGATRRAATTLGMDPDVAHLLSVKERQIQEAMHVALGVDFSAIAQPGGLNESTAPAVFASAGTMAPVAPGQTFVVKTTFTNRSPLNVAGVTIGLSAQSGWKINGPRDSTAARPNDAVLRTFTVTVPSDAKPTRQYFHRNSIAETRYIVDDKTQIHRPTAEPPLSARARYDVDGVPVEIQCPVTRFEAQLPYGYQSRVLAVLPVIAVRIGPEQAVVPLANTKKTLRVRVELTGNRDAATEGALSLRAPSGWKVEPPSQTFRFSRAGERASYTFVVSIPSLENRDYRLEAVARMEGRDYREGYEVIEHRDLETHYLFRDAVALVRGVDVKIAPGLRVGYVMGVGDQVPEGIAQLGVGVQLLGRDELASADLRGFDAIMTGTRAYAVREDLNTYNQRLLEYVKTGGNLIVLYNTQEFVPTRDAPYRGELPRSAEEVSEENSPVEILAPANPVFRTPNAITKADFDGWIEQRGSKFWSTWDAAYTPLLATWDRGQAPQKGGWLHARYGKGHYTYFAYAFHRQLPYGVPGAYRVLANLLSLAKSAAGTKTP